MNPLDLLGIGTSIVNKVLDFIPDPAAKAKAAADAQAALMSMAQAQFTQQADITKTEAGSSDWFVAGARPFILWVCGMSIAYTYVLQPFIVAGARIFEPGFAPPTLDSGDLMALVTAMLGLGGMHAYENIKGAQAAAASPQ